MMKKCSSGRFHEKLQTPTLLLFRYPKASISPSGYLQVETVPIALIATVDNKLITVSNGPNDIVHGIQKRRSPIKIFLLRP